MIKDENEKITARVEEYHNKIIKLQQKEKNTEYNSKELESLKETYMKTIDEKEVDLAHKEEELKRKFEINEKAMKTNMKKMYDDLKIEYVKEIKSHNEQIESLKYENNELKFQIRNYKNQSEFQNFDSVIREKEIEFNETILKKDKEIAKYLKVLEAFENELQDLKDNYRRISSQPNLNTSNDYYSPNHNGNKSLREVKYINNLIFNILT